MVESCSFRDDGYALFCCLARIPSSVVLLRGDVDPALWWLVKYQIAVGGHRKDSRQVSELKQMGFGGSRLENDKL